MPRGDTRRTASRGATRGLDLRVAIIPAVAANTNAAVPGIVPGDIILSVIEHPAAAAMVDQTANVRITSNGNVQSTVALANQAVVIWTKR